MKAPRLVNWLNDPYSLIQSYSPRVVGVKSTISQKMRGGVWVPFTGSCHPTHQTFTRHLRSSQSNRHSLPLLTSLSVCTIWHRKTICSDKYYFLISCFHLSYHYYWGFHIYIYVISKEKFFCVFINKKKKKEIYTYKNNNIVRRISFFVCYWFIKWNELV